MFSLLYKCVRRDLLVVLPVQFRQLLWTEKHFPSFCHNLLFIDIALLLDKTLKGNIQAGIETSAKILIEPPELCTHEIFWFTY